MVGANPIIAVDLDDEKLAFAKQFGATHGVNAANEDPVAAIHALTVREANSILVSNRFLVPTTPSTA